MSFSKDVARGKGLLFLDQDLETDLEKDRRTRTGLRVMERLLRGENDGDREM